MFKNDELKHKRNYRKAWCCENCKHKGHGMFRDRVSCGLLDWDSGSDVIPTHICDWFEVKKE